MTTTNSPPPHLTATFTPPASCFTSNNVYLDSDSVTTAGMVYYVGNILGPSLVPTECYPPQWKPIDDFFFSPGVCPSGYTTATSSVDVIGGTATETRATCCPR